jgi:hypothetical protein
MYYSYIKQENFKHLLQYHVLLNLAAKINTM